MPAKTIAEELRNLAASIKVKILTEMSVVDTLEKMIGKKLEVGRANIDGYPVDVGDENGPVLTPADADAAKALLKILRQKGLKPKFDKKDGVIYFENVDGREDGADTLLAESVASNSAKILTEEAPVAPPSLLLTECCYSQPCYDSYVQRTFEERLRDAVSMIQDAMVDEAFKGIGDDGRVIKNNWSEGEDPWGEAREVVRKAVTVNNLKALLPQVRAVLDKYLK